MGCCTSCCGEDTGSQVRKSPLDSAKMQKSKPLSITRIGLTTTTAFLCVFVTVFVCGVHIRIHICKFNLIYYFQSGEVTERTRLLEDPVSNNTNIQRVHSDDFLARYPSSLPKTSDEQSALNRILQETAS
jgi:hypothetical protein